MAQQQQNPLSILKSTNTSTASLEPIRSRSGSILRHISHHPELSRTTTNSSTASFKSSDEEPFFSANVEDYEIKSPIGYGSSAVVYNATYEPKNTRIAIKMIDLDLFERNQIDELRRETALMALSKHPNVLKVLNSFVHGSKLYIVTPYLSGGSCLDIMKCSFQEGFEEVTIATILKQALEGLVYLHKNGHIHRDVKAGNLLVDELGNVLLADFGVSSSLTENNEVRKTFVGTPCWMAPEVMEQSGYDFKADIWSFGITSLELATGHAPFAKFPPLKVLMMTLNQSPPTLDRDHTKHKYSRLFKEMIDLCLCKDPAKRPTAEKLILHPFFKQSKKKDYLIKSVLSQIPPIDQRPHKMIQFKQTVLEQKLDDQNWDFDDQPKKHISFLEKPLDLLPSPAPSTETLSPVPVRKSRFVIEEQSPLQESSTSIQRSLSPEGEIGVGLGITAVEKKGRFSVNHPFVKANDISKSDCLESPYVEANSLSRKSRLEIDSLVDSPAYSDHAESNSLSKKSRFEIEESSYVETNSLSRKSRFEIGESPYVESNTLSQQCNVEANSLSKKSRFEVDASPYIETNRKSRFEIDDTDTSRKSRFEVQHDIPLTREFSNHPRRLSRESHSSKVCRFSIEKEDFDGTSSPYKAMMVMHHMETLLKQTEIQKSMLQDLLYGFNKPRSRSVSNPRLEPDVASIVEHLQQLLLVASKEKERLQRENEQLRKEVQLLKQQQIEPSTHTPADQHL